ncbi:biotin-dependent carboxyltransferase family protein [Pseudomonas sp. Gutcm_11s]|uniref:5-oxoprolinase subunit C family protein n=1 Tax=Pseudomonas sp. Gutcm_11s TaxID=3026088 RepID=UPI002360BC7E|nr:biotin-dependent carboxyltransferase family protein [Pseudomonas sp. Gutcm_11s]MDD0845392.1 biotin-dependent carboxyltransferase family protein [Pseudomonas sp. Gutcm_11s]
MSGLRVLKPGPLSLLQDAGRQGWQHLGVSPSGAQDGHAAAWANRLLGNAWGAPLLEIALGGVELLAEVDTCLALTGAPATARLDDAPLLAWSRFAVRAGQRLHIDFARSGQRLYLAAAGGFQALPVLGSVSTQVREELGGLNGRGGRLLAGDLLPCGTATGERAASVPWPFQPDYRAIPLLRVITGGDAVEFAAEQLQSFFAQAWQLSPQSDRMGARLLGEPLAPPQRQWSLGMSRGAIQVPPDGQPIILQADRQTMGGYPVLGWLHPLDQWRLAQCTPRHPLHFTQVSVSDAQADLREFYCFFRG